MNATTAADLRDRTTAAAALMRVRDDLNTAVDNLCNRTDGLVDQVVNIRPQGLLTVDEMAEAIGRDRNYVDSIWSAHGETTKGKQTRVPVAEGVDASAARTAYKLLAESASDLKTARDSVVKARSERDRVVAEVYRSKLIGPSDIAKAVEVDRNHVLRIARKAGVKPVHRTSSKNQYTAGN